MTNSAVAPHVKPDSSQTTSCPLLPPTEEARLPGAGRKIVPKPSQLFDLSPQFPQSSESRHQSSLALSKEPQFAHFLGPWMLAQWGCPTNDFLKKHLRAKPPILRIPLRTPANFALSSCNFNKASSVFCKRFSARPIISHNYRGVLPQDLERLPVWLSSNPLEETELQDSPRCPLLRELLAT